MEANEWTAALAGVLFATQIAFLVNGYTRAAAATFLLFTVLMVVVRYRRKKHKV
jgi:hypothetical protein